MKINDNETRKLIRRILQNRLSIEDLSKSQIKEIDYQAGLMSNAGLREINGLLIVNPGTTFEYWANTIDLYKDSLRLKHWLQQNEPKEGAKPPPEENLIVFETGIADKLKSELVGFFKGREADLSKALNGEQLDTKLLFPRNQNQFVEVFKRAKYNGFIVSSKKEIKGWICSNFCYQHNSESLPFNPETVWDVLSKEAKETAKANRICKPDWLPYIPLKDRKQNKHSEF